MHPVAHKTKIVCTIGPASSKPEVLEKMLRAGMNVARLNFSHGDFAAHEAAIKTIRAAAETTGKRVAIMADLPGPKMRVGEMAGVIELRDGDLFTLTTQTVVGSAARASVSFEALPRVVKPGDMLFLNDGFIQLKVENTKGRDVECRVVVGGELSSRKGLNLPGIDLGISAFTPRDRECLEFALAQGIDAVSQSFVNSAADIEAVREVAAQHNQRIFIIAKIERASALDNIDGILGSSDGIMIARGDLGVEIAIERIAIIQKQLTRKANRLGKPVITATHMLESMVSHRRPTRAEATDVANAILDGTDCVMLSGESAMGKYPVEAVEMLAKIAAAAESSVPMTETVQRLRIARREDEAAAADVIAVGAQDMLKVANARALVAPTRSGASARNVARFRAPVWTLAFSTEEATCRELLFSYGVHAVKAPQEHADWSVFARQWLRDYGLSEGTVLLIQGPSPQNPAANFRIEILEL